MGKREEKLKTNQGNVHKDKEVYLGSPSFQLKK